jgi:PAS domain S-box-containing protein
LTTELITKRLQERIADAVPALVAVYNIQTGQYLYANRALTKILGYTPEELIEGGMDFAVSLIHPEDSARLLEQNQAALEAANKMPDQDEEPIAEFEYRMRHKNGSWRWVHTEGTVFSRSADGQVELILNVSLDITDRKVAENQLRKSLKILEGIISR